MQCKIFSNQWDVSQKQNKNYHQLMQQMEDISTNIHMSFAVSKAPRGLSSVVE